MTTAGEKVQVTVSESLGDEKKKRLNIEVEVDRKYVALSELLAAEGAIETLAKRIKKVCRIEALQFVSEGRSLIGKVKEFPNKDTNGLTEP